MRLFRVFDWDGVSLGRSEGGPLFVARSRQGSGRHDAPALYGAWYCSRAAVSAVAECIQYLRGHLLEESDFQRSSRITKALVGFDLAESLDIVDLDDPSQLLERQLRPSQVATLGRSVTQAIAASVFREGAAGLTWWSTLEAEWTNVTLFYERALARVSIAVPPRTLSLRMAEVREAAQRLGIHV